VRCDLANARMGQLVGADHRTYSQVVARIQRPEIEALVEGGCPVVTYLPGGRLIWHDEGDAWPAWADARSAPQPVTGGRWESPDGATAVVLVLHD
jgi:sugar phosphate isomerase/epimerase